MRPTMLWSVVAVSATLAVACNDSTSPGEDSFEWRGQIAAGDRIEIKGVNGRILAQGTTANEVVVSAVKTSQQSDVASVTIDVVTHANGVTICAVYPDVQGQPPNECLPGDQGSMSVQNNDVNVAFDVSVPVNVVFVGRTVNGDVIAEGLGANGFVMTVNGDATVETSGLGEATTVNGTVNADIGLPDWDRDLGFLAVNGDVTVTVPAATNAEVRLTTVNGSITSDFPSVTEVSLGSYQGTIGAGGRVLTATTTNGNVALRQGS